jgi:hypothetical protein
MNLSGQRVKLYLTEEGEDYLFRIAGYPSLSIVPVKVDITETDDLGIWIQKKLDGHTTSVLLLRWEFILGTEIDEENRKLIGLMR